MGSHPCAQPLRGVSSPGGDNRLVCEQQTDGFRKISRQEQEHPLQWLSDVRIVKRGIVEQNCGGIQWRVVLKAAFSAAGRSGRTRGGTDGC